MPKARPILKAPPIVLSVPHKPASAVWVSTQENQADRLTCCPAVYPLLESKGGEKHRKLPSRHGEGRPPCRREGAARGRIRRRRPGDHGPLPARRRGAP